MNIGIVCDSSIHSTGGNIFSMTSNIPYNTMWRHIYICTCIVCTWWTLINLRHKQIHAFVILFMYMNHFAIFRYSYHSWWGIIFRDDRRVHRYILYQNFRMLSLVLYPPPPSLEAVYYFICSRRRVSVARYRMICLALEGLNVPPSSVDVKMDYVGSIKMVNFRLYTSPYSWRIYTLLYHSRLVHYNSHPRVCFESYD